MLSALIPSAGRKPAVPLAGQLAHESCVRPGPLVLGTAFLRFPTAAPDRDRTVSRMFSRITTGIDYTFTLFLGAGVSWRPCLEMILFVATPSPRCGKRGSRYRGTTRPCYADVAQHLRRRSASFSNSLGCKNVDFPCKLHASNALIVLAFPRYCPEVTVR